MKADNVKGDNEEPVWQTLYSVKDCYQLSDLSTNSWHLFINRTLTDDTMTELYYRNYHRNSSQYVKTRGVQGVDLVLELRMGIRGWILGPKN